MHGAVHDPDKALAGGAVLPKNICLAVSIIPVAIRSLILSRIHPAKCKEVNSEGIARAL